LKASDQFGARSPRNWRETYGNLLPFMASRLPVELIKSPN